MSAHLPALLAEIAEVVGAALQDPQAGVEAALKLAAERGGRRVHITSSLPEGHWLSRTLGQAAAQAVVDHFRSGRGGIELDIPLGPGGSYLSERRVRARKLAAALSAGLNASQAAAAVGVTRRSIYKARKRLRPDGRQGSLFKE